MPRRRRLIRGQTAMHNKYKSHEKEKTVPLHRKSASLISVKNTVESELHLTNPINEDYKPIPLKSCLSSQQQSDKIKMKVKFYLKTGDGKYRNVAQRSPDLNKNKRKRKEPMTTHQQNSVLHNNKIGFYRRGIAGDKVAKQISIKQKEHDDKIEPVTRFCTTFLKNSFANQIKNIIIEKSKKRSDTSLRRRRKPIRIKEYSSYSTILNSKLKLSFIMGEDKNHTIKENRIDNTLIDKHKIAPKTVNSRQKIWDGLDMIKENIHTTSDLPIPTSPQSKKSNKTLKRNVDRGGKSQNDQNDQRNNYYKAKKSLSAIVYRDICVTGNKLKLWKPRRRNKKRRVLSLRIGNETSSNNIKYYSDGTSTDSKKYNSDQQNTQIANNTSSGIFSHMAKDIKYEEIRSKIKFWASKKFYENIKSSKVNESKSALDVDKNVLKSFVDNISEQNRSRMIGQSTNEVQIKPKSSSVSGKRKTVTETETRTHMLPNCRNSNESLKTNDSSTKHIHFNEIVAGLNNGATSNVQNQKLLNKQLLKDSSKKNYTDVYFNKLHKINFLMNKKYPSTSKQQSDLNISSNFPEKISVSPIKNALDEHQSENLLNIEHEKCRLEIPKNRFLKFLQKLKLRGIGTKGNEWVKTKSKQEDQHSGQRCKREISTSELGSVIGMRTSNVIMSSTHEFAMHQDYEQPTEEHRMITPSSSTYPLKQRPGYFGFIHKQLCNCQVYFLHQYQHFLRENVILTICNKCGNNLSECKCQTKSNQSCKFSVKRNNQQSSPKLGDVRLNHHNECLAKQPIKYLAKQTIKCPAKQTVKCPVKQVIECPCAAKQLIKCHAKQTIKCPVKQVIECPCSPKQTIKCHAKQPIEHPYPAKQSIKIVKQPIETPTRQSIKTANEHINSSVKQSSKSPTNQRVIYPSKQNTKIPLKPAIKVPANQCKCSKNEYCMKKIRDNAPASTCKYCMEQYKDSTPTTFEYHIQQNIDNDVSSPSEYLLHLQKQNSPSTSKYRMKQLQDKTRSTNEYHIQQNIDNVSSPSEYLLQLQKENSPSASKYRMKQLQDNTHYTECPTQQNTNNARSPYENLSKYFENIMKNIRGSRNNLKICSECEKTQHDLQQPRSYRRRRRQRPSGIASTRRTRTFAKNKGVNEKQGWQWDIYRKIRRHTDCIEGDCKFYMNAAKKKRCDCSNTKCFLSSSLNCFKFMSRIISISLAVTASLPCVLLLCFCRKYICHCLS